MVDETDGSSSGTGNLKEPELVENEFWIFILDPVDIHFTYKVNQISNPHTNFEQIFQILPIGTSTKQRTRM